MRFPDSSIRPRISPVRRAFTLVEILVTIMVLGIAGALVIPAMGSTGILKVQAAVRNIVADITLIQSEAVAFQERRAIIFDVASNTYRLVEVPGDTIDPVTNTMYDPSSPSGLYIVDLNDDRFGGARLQSAEFDGDSILIFDGMGGPVTDAAGNTPSSGGSITLTGSDQTFRISIDAFTGRVGVQNITPP